MDWWLAGVLGIPITAIIISAAVVTIEAAIAWVASTNHAGLRVVPCHGAALPQGGLMTSILAAVGSLRKQVALALGWHIGTIQAQPCVWLDVSLDPEQVAAASILRRKVEWSSQGASLAAPIPIVTMDALTTAATLPLLTDSQLTMPVLGAVKLRSQLHQFIPCTIQHPVHIVSFMTLAKQHKVGCTVEIVVSVFQADQTSPHPGALLSAAQAAFAGHQPVTGTPRLAWQGVTTVAFFCKPADTLLPADTAKPPIPVDREAALQQGHCEHLHLPAGLGRQYASICGDYNPIHVSAIGAKLFGFHTALAHGMCVMELCAPQLTEAVADSQHGELADLHPEQVSALASTGAPGCARLDVWYRSPAWLGSTVVLHTLRTEANAGHDDSHRAVDFAVLAGGSAGAKPVCIGTYEMDL